MGYIKLSASSEVLNRLIPLKGRVVEGRVVGKAGELSLLEIEDLLLTAESKLPLKVGSRVSLWVKGLFGDKLHLQLLSEEDVDESFLKLNLRGTPENRLAYSFLKGLGLSFGREEVELLGELISKSKDLSFLLDSLRVLHLKVGSLRSLLRLLVHLGDTFLLRELLLKLLFYGDEDIRKMLNNIVPRAKYISAESIKAFLYQSGIAGSGELMKLLLESESPDGVRLLTWLLFPRLFSLSTKGEGLILFFWFPLFWGEGDIVIPTLKKHKGKEGEKKEEERYEMLLELKSLGRIRVLFYLLRGKIWITFEAEDEKTLSLIKAHLRELSSSLEGQGYKVGGLSSRFMVIERPIEGEALDIKI